MNVFNDNDSDRRGQVGIGTLIIFIAMVLVAAVAAGVLVNTAGLLEQRASNTGSEAQSEVSNQIQVLSATGAVSGDSIDNITMVVKKSPGSEKIDLEDATIHYLSDDKDETLVHNTSAGSGQFKIDSSTDVIVGDNDLVLDDSTERIELTIDLSSGGLDDELGQGEEATLRLVDQSGATTVYGVTVPQTLSGENYVGL